MKIYLDQKGPELDFNLDITAEDSQEGAGQYGPIQLRANKFRFVLPTTSEMHPDLLAAALLTVVLPFSGRQIEMPRAMSTTFADAVHRAFEKELTPVNSQLGARGSGTRPGLAFSGGVDSLAAMLLIPKNCALGFFERVRHLTVNVSDQFNTYDPGPALQICAALERQGRSVYRVQSDHEYIIAPGPDWSTWMGKASPLILLADALNLDSLCFGTVLETTYLPVWHQHHYSPVDDVNHPWAQVMAAVGMPLARPVGGISEVGTTAIVEASPYRDMSTSCADGPSGQPCMICTKCLRKTLIGSALNNTIPAKAVLQRFSEQPKIRKQFSNGIIYGQPAYMYCFQKLPSLPNMYFGRVQKAMQAISPNMRFMERWYPKSLELIPDNYRNIFIEQKNRFLPDYTEAEVHQVENWSTPPFHLIQPGLGEIVATQFQKKVRGAKRRTENLLRRIGAN